MEVAPGDGKNSLSSFRLKDEALAGQELFCRAELHNSALQLPEAFLSSAAVVGKVAGVAVKIQNERRIVLPGERVVIPVSVVNMGNFRENLTIKTSIPSSIRHALYGAEEAASNRPMNLLPALSVPSPLVKRRHLNWSCLLLPLLPTNQKRHIRLLLNRRVAGTSPQLFQCTLCIHAQW